VERTFPFLFFFFSTTAVHSSITTLLCLRALQVSQKEVPLSFSFFPPELALFCRRPFLLSFLFFRAARTNRRQRPVVFFFSFFFSPSTLAGPSPLPPGFFSFPPTGRIQVTTAGFHHLPLFLPLFFGESRGSRPNPRHAGATNYSPLFALTIGMGRRRRGHPISPSAAAIDAGRTETTNFTISLCSLFFPGRNHRAPPLQRGRQEAKEVETVRPSSPFSFFPFPPSRGAFSLFPSGRGTEIHPRWITFCLSLTPRRSVVSQYAKGFFPTSFLSLSTGALTSTAPRRRGSLFLFFPL